jgi:hippurate hydrolase
VLVASHIVTALQSILSRNVPPSETAVLSVTRIVAGEAYNVIPESASIAGTARAFNSDVMAKIEANMKRIAKGVAEGFGASAEVDFRVIFAPLINDAGPTGLIADAAALLVGEPNVDRNKPPSMGSEDFSFMMEKVPGAYIQVGNGDSAQLHNPAYDFNDACTPYGAAVLATVAERSLKA